MTTQRIGLLTLLRKVVVTALLVAIGIAIGARWFGRATPSLAAQAQCAAKADAGGLWSGTVYSTHFNAQLNRCFADSEDTVATSDPNSPHQPAPAMFETRQVFDVFEGRSLGMFRAYDDRPGEPLVCWVAAPSGESKSCRNEFEWESLTRIYLER